MFVSVCEIIKWICFVFGVEFAAYCCLDILEILNQWPGNFEHCPENR